MQFVALGTNVKLSGFHSSGSWSSWHSRIIDFVRCLIELTGVAKPLLVLSTYLCIVFHACKAFQINVLILLGRIMV